MKDFYRYKHKDIVQVTDPLSPFEDRVGIICKADNKVMRYVVEFEDGYKESFSYNQIMPHRPKEALESLIDLSLALGPAAEDLFYDWVMEYQLRFGKREN